MKVELEYCYSKLVASRRVAIASKVTIRIVKSLLLVIVVGYLVVY